MHDMSVLLNNSNIGGKIGGILVNHLSYAGDMCLVSLSSRGMIQLVNICDNFAMSHCLTYNTQGRIEDFFPGGSVCIKVTEKYLGNVGGSHGGGFGLPQENFEYEVL